MLTGEHLQVMTSHDSQVSLILSKTLLEAFRSSSTFMYM